MPTSWELQDFLKSRRSIRRFKSDAIPDSVLETLLNTAAYAPSAHNRQPWRFVVVRDPVVREMLASTLSDEFERDLINDHIPSDEIQSKVERSRSRILAAPLVIILCMDMTEMDKYPDEKRRHAEYLMATQSTANAGLQLLLAAHAEGLGGVWVCNPLFAPQMIRKVLDLPAEWEPQAMYFLGYPQDVPHPRDKKSIHDITLFK